MPQVKVRHSTTCTWQRTLRNSVEVYKALIYLLSHLSSHPHNKNRVDVRAN